jgi:dCTP diphosphatase
MNLDNAQRRARRFVEERNWERHHTPKNLAMALAGEVGELMELFQWRTEDEASRIMNTADGAHVEEELADVAIYVLRIADVLGIDLERAVEAKLTTNERQYPISDSNAK